MNMRRFVPDTQREYIRAVKKLASFLGRSPDSATPESNMSISMGEVSLKRPDGAAHLEHR
jgi:hypothetical protein